MLFQREKKEQMEVRQSFIKSEREEFPLSDLNLIKFLSAKDIGETLTHFQAVMNKLQRKKSIRLALDLFATMEARSKNKRVSIDYFRIRPQPTYLVPAQDIIHL